MILIALHGADLPNDVTPKPHWTDANVDKPSERSVLNYTRDYVSRQWSLGALGSFRPLILRLRDWLPFTAAVIRRRGKQVRQLFCSENVAVECFAPS
jgi:hypothetical protein